MVPIKYSMNFIFEPLHEEALGTDPTGEFLNGNFPYNQETPGSSKALTVAASDINTFGGD